MNWNSHEFIWLDWVILIVGMAAVISVSYTHLDVYKRQEFYFQFLFCHNFLNKILCTFTQFRTTQKLIYQEIKLTNIQPHPRCV